MHFRFLLIVMFVGVGLFTSSKITGDELDRTSLDAELIEYDKKINAILRTRLPEEKAYVLSIVVMVSEGKLPKKVVDNALYWVIAKRINANYAFIYFERIIRLQSKKINVEVPEFDESIYSKKRNIRNQR